MRPFISGTVAEQFAAHLKQQIGEGRLFGVMPGVLRLEADTGVNRKTVEAALRILESDGLLQGQGAGKRRLIVGDAGCKTGSGLKIGFFLFERRDAGIDYFLSLEHSLGAAGHQVERAAASLTELNMDKRRVARLVTSIKADAWMLASASREVLQWFIGENIPVMALFGRRRGLPLASVGPDKIPAFREATRKLIGLGHRRIVWLTRRMRRLPKPGEAEQAFLDELAAHGIPAGAYNLPDWEESVVGLHICLESLFRITPPTAIIADEAQFYLATQNYLSSRGLCVPGDVSIVCTEGDRIFEWCTPSVAHINWESRPLVRRILKWVENINRGKQDHSHTFIRAEFVNGGTIDRAKK